MKTYSCGVCFTSLCLSLSLSLSLSLLVFLSLSLSLSLSLARALSLAPSLAAVLQEHARLETYLGCDTGAISLLSSAHGVLRVRPLLIRLKRLGFCRGMSVDERNPPAPGRWPMIIPLIIMKHVCRRKVSARSRPMTNDNTIDNYETCL